MFDIASIFSWFRKTFLARDLAIVLFLVIAYFLTRLINLDQFPIFGDEGIYIHWAKVAWHDANWRFISLTDGRQPLQTWATIPFLKLFPNNALLGGRLFGVACGFLGLSGLFSTLLYLFNKKTAYIGALLFILTPYFLFYDRMALMDSGITAGVIWMFFFSLLLARTRRLDIAIIYGVIVGFTLLGKSSVKLYAGVMITSGIYILLSKKYTSIREKVSPLVNFIFLYAVAMGLAILIYNIQRLSPFFHFVTQKNTTFVLTISELLQDPFQLIFANSWRIPYYIFSELGYVVGLVSLVGTWYLFKKERTLSFYFLSVWILSFCAIASVAKVLYPRYVQALGMLLLIPAAYYLSVMKNKKLIIGIWTAIIISVSYFHYTIIFKPADIPFPQVDRGQYIEGWPAGWGIKDIVEIARKDSKSQKVVLLAEGNFGVSGDVLDTHLKPSDTNIRVDGKWPLDLPVIQEAQKKYLSEKVYVVFSHTRSVPSDWPVTFVKKYDKPGDESEILLYLLKKK